jgi:DNA-binding response OmpR family regulator
LILEDDATLRKLFTAMLESRHYTVSSVSTAAEAIRICKKQPVDLFMADVVLPASSGPHVALELHQSCPKMAILFVSGTPIAGWRDSDFEDFRHLLSGSVDFLQKPFTLTALMVRVENLLSGTSPLTEFRTLLAEAESDRCTLKVLHA